MKFRASGRLVSSTKWWLKIAACAGALIGVSTAHAQTSVYVSSTPLADRAASYIELRNDIQIIDSNPIDNASVTRDAHNRLASHSPETLSSGWLAYAALVAADTPGFAQSLQEATATEALRTQFISELQSNPRSVRNLAGAQDAIDAVMVLAAKDAAKIQGIGDRYTQDAYSLQNKSWARRKLPTDGPSRVYEAENYSYSRAWMGTPVLPTSTTLGIRQPGLQYSDYLWKPDWSSYTASPYRNPRAAPIFDRILILAARYAVGEITEPIVNGYSKSSSSQRCFNTAKLNLSQCIAASRSPTEEVFCIGRHGLSETGSCVGWIASAN